MRAWWEGRRFPSPMTVLVIVWGVAIYAGATLIRWLLW